MSDHDYALTGAGLAVLAALEALDAATDRDAAAPIDYYPTDARVDTDAHGS